MMAAAFGIFKGTDSGLLIGDAVSGMDYDNQRIPKEKGAVMSSVLSIAALSFLVVAALVALVLVRKFESSQKARFEVQNYIRAAKERGFDDEQIHQRLVEQGWEPVGVLHHFRD